MISIGDKDFDEHELVSQIDLEINILDAQIEALKQWRETRLELRAWLKGVIPDG